MVRQVQPDNRKHQRQHGNPGCRHGLAISEKVSRTPIRSGPLARSAIGSGCRTATDYRPGSTRPRDRYTRRRRRGRPDACQQQQSWAGTLPIRVCCHERERGLAATADCSAINCGVVIEKAKQIWRPMRGLWLSRPRVMAKRHETSEERTRARSTAAISGPAGNLAAGRSNRAAMIEPRAAGSAHAAPGVERTRDPSKRSQRDPHALIV